MVFRDGETRNLSERSYKPEFEGQELPESEGQELGTEKRTKIVPGALGEA